MNYKHFCLNVLRTLLISNLIFSPVFDLITLSRQKEIFNLERNTNFIFVMNWHSIVVVNLSIQFQFQEDCQPGEQRNIQFCLQGKHKHHISKSTLMWLANTLKNVNVNLSIILSRNLFFGYMRHLNL